MIQANNASSQDSFEVVNVCEELLVLSSAFLVSLLIYELSYYLVTLDNFSVRALLVGFLISSAIIILASMPFCLNEISIKRVASNALIEIHPHALSLIILFPLIILASLTGSLSIDETGFNKREYIEPSYKILTRKGLRSPDKTISFIVGVSILLLLILILNHKLVILDINESFCMLIGVLISVFIFTMTYSLKSEIVVVDKAGNEVISISGIRKNKARKFIEFLLREK